MLLPLVGGFFADLDEKIVPGLRELVSALLLLLLLLLIMVMILLAALLLPILEVLLFCFLFVVVADADCPEELPIFL